MMSQIMDTIFKKTARLKKMIERRDKKYILDEDDFITLAEKALKWDEFNANFKGGEN